MPSPELPIEALTQLLSYCPESGVLLWKRRDKCRRGWNSQFAGKPAGWSATRGYVALTIHGRRYRASRVIWAMVHGEWPSNYIDHINRDTSDNRLANLRQVTPAGNARNRGVRSDNTSGLMGVSSHKRSRKWAAAIYVAGRQKHLGLFQSKQSAAAVYQAAKQTFHAIEEV